MHWLVFTEAGCTDWFLRRQGVLAGFLQSEGALAEFYRARVRWMVFKEPKGARGVPGKHIENIKEANGKYKGIYWNTNLRQFRC